MGDGPSRIESDIQNDDIENRFQFNIRQLMKKSIMNKYHHQSSQNNFPKSSFTNMNEANLSFQIKNGPVIRKDSTLILDQDMSYELNKTQNDNENNIFNMSPRHSDSRSGKN